MNTDWRPAASRSVLEARARLLADIRSFFSARNVLEVETPVLSAAGNTDPNIAGLWTETIPPAYLRTSPEYAMKRLLAAGLPDIYELGRVFRDGESGRWHNPEFTMLEWYRLGCAYLELADEAIELVRHCGGGMFDHWPVKRCTYQDLFLEHVGLDPHMADESEWASKAAELGIRSTPLDQQQYQDLLLSHVIQPALEPESLTLVYDYPAQQSALAGIRAGNPDVAERFELYLGGAELANGYHELSDAKQQRARFERDKQQRRFHGRGAPPIDERLISALQHGMPDCSGVALGVDRLLMRLAGLENIDAVLAFPSSRA